MVQPTKAKAIERLRKVLDAIPELKNLRERDVSPGFEKWRRDTQVAITNTFGKDSRHIGDFNGIDYIRPFMVTDFSNPSDSEDQADYVKGLQSAASVLESMLNEIEEYWEEDEQSSKTSDSRAKMPKSTNKVFVIHGHDESARETVARFLERLELDPVILHEQPNKGRTIIEKFEEHAQVWFAVVLLTPDDVGALADDKKNQNPRARQNVIFEFVYFIGKLGRERVCALVKGNVETPSDYDGVIYIPLDGSDSWKLRLFQELKSVGFKVDANQVF